MSFPLSEFGLPRVRPHLASMSPPLRSNTYLRVRVGDPNPTKGRKAWHSVYCYLRSILLILSFFQILSERWSCNKSRLSAVPHKTQQKKKKCSPLHVKWWYWIAEPRIGSELEKLGTKMEFFPSFSDNICIFPLRSSTYMVHTPPLFPPPPVMLFFYLILWIYSR